MTDTRNTTTESIRESCRPPDLKRDQCTQLHRVASAGHLIIRKEKGTAKSRPQIKVGGSDSKWGVAESITLGKAYRWSKIGGERKESGN